MSGEVPRSYADQIAILEGHCLILADKAPTNRVRPY
jgi:hypothetical protein